MQNSTMGSTVSGFVWTTHNVRYANGNRETIVREHPAYRREDGQVVWAPNREFWRDAEGDEAATFVAREDLTDADRARAGRYAA